MIGNIVANITKKRKKKKKRGPQLYVVPRIDDFTLQIAIKSSSVVLISLRAVATFLCRGEMSFHIGISHTGIGATLRSSASLRTVYTACSSQNRKTAIC